MKYVQAVLWRNFNKATFDTLAGNSKGQYDIRLGSTLPLDDFFKGETRSNNTELGGFDIRIQVEGFGSSDNDEYIPQQELNIRYMGSQSARKDWNIPSQRPETAYPLWVDADRYPGTIDEKSYIILIRTVDGRYYGRLLLRSEIQTLPFAIETRIEEKKDVGMVILDHVSGSEKAIEIYEKLLLHTNLLLYGPPGTGKTTLIQEVVKIFSHGGPSSVCFDENRKRDYFSELGVNKSSKVEWTTFHQSYSYEEFVMGLTTDSQDSKLLSIGPKPGKLLELSEFARMPGNRSLLVVDELNRANVSKVFGEFITLIEPDKRLDINGNKTEKTVKIELPYIGENETVSFTVDGKPVALENPFTMPKDVYTIASMNSVDKSTFPLDSAMRRRFYRQNIYPEIAELTKHFGLSDVYFVGESLQSIDDVSIVDVKILIRDFMKYLNDKIKIFLGLDYTLGFSYVWKLSEAKNVKEIVDMFKESLFEQIIPQLEEIFRNRDEQLLYILGAAEGELSPYIVIQPTEEEVELGAFSSKNMNLYDFDGIEIVNWLMRLLEK